jgi:hypothetical protein
MEAINSTETLISIYQTVTSQKTALFNDSIYMCNFASYPIGTEASFLEVRRQGREAVNTSI